MRQLLIVGLLLLTTGACAVRLEEVVGAYDLVRFQGKPLPFGGVRTSEMTLLPDGTVLVYTDRAVGPGQPESVRDTLTGRFSVGAWNAQCTMVYLRFDNPPDMGEYMAEVCDDEFTIFDRDAVYRRRGGMIGGTSGLP